MGTYDVTVINKGRENDYYDFWNKGLKTNDSGEELHPELVGFSEIVDAKNLEDAISKVQKKHPENIISRDSSSKVG
ncbi:hypothetical protein [Aeromonas veronii]|uniref:hypothetical protein n=1 Tax=Aeromonas TaxID=642 RepID=UPI001116C615|nr:hypothetical protein [Aeromonas veronii]